MPHQVENYTMTVQQYISNQNNSFEQDDGVITTMDNPETIFEGTMPGMTESCEYIKTKQTELAENSTNFDNGNT